MMIGLIDSIFCQKIATGLNGDSGLELFYIRNGSLYHRKQLNAEVDWSVEEVYSSDVKNVYMSTGYQGELELLFIDNNNDLYNSRLILTDDEWPAGNLVSSNIIDLCMIRNAAGYLQLFYIKEDHSVKYRQQIETGIGWSAESDFLDYAGKIAAGCNADGRIEVFYAATGDTLKHKYQLAPGGTWSDVAIFAGKAIDINVAQNNDGRLEVFYISPDYKLYHKWQVAPSSGWDVAALFSNEARLVKTENNPDGRIEIFLSNNKNVLHHNWQTTPNNGWGTGEQFGWYAVDLDVTKNFDGRLEVFYIGTDGILYHRWQLAPGMYWSSEYPFIDADPPFSFDEYNVLPSFQNNPDWHINDHCFIKSSSNKWHMFGIMYPDPGSGDMSYVNYLGHASADSLDEIPWTEETPPFYETLESGDVLWAPHIVYHDNLYYMFYCNGGDVENYKMCLRTSEDLITWSDKQILFHDGFQARDPMVLFVEEINKWVIYYCATENSSAGNHIVAYRTSDDLINWGTRQIAYLDLHYGTDYGPTESPYVVKRGSYYYLFIGLRPYDFPSWFENWEHPGYKGTDVFRSTSWNQWKNSDFVGWIDAHAPEIINDNGSWYISHCGVLQGGLFIRRMYWNDGVNGIETNTAQTEKNTILQSCTPNPFSGKAEINYSLIEQGTIRIDIIDLSGRVIINLIDKFHAPGNYSVNIATTKNSSNILNPGIYFCRLLAGNHKEMIKIVAF